MVLHRPLGPFVRIFIVVTAAASAGAQSVDSVVEKLVEDQIGLEVESELADELQRAVEQKLESALLGDVEGLLADTVADVAEIVPAPAETFFPEIDERGRKVERGVWLLLVTPEQLVEVERLGLVIREQRPLAALGQVLLRVEAPAEGDLAEAARELARRAPGAQIDANHVYGTESRPIATPAVNDTPTGAAAVAPGLTIGIVDSAVAREHPALRSADIVQADFVPYARPRPSAHGTAVASILVGESASLSGRLPGARLYAGSVFFEQEDGESAATTASLVRALDWLAVSGVGVINMSLSGPPNRVLEAAIAAITAHGTIVVAAVGNAGPAAAPLYPAAYETVVGITAVDSAHRIYRYASRGPQVTFAARGVDVPVARAEGEGRASGTSFAAPHAAAILARARSVTADRAPERLLAALKATALDLGETGFDETFGYGLIVETE